MNYFKAKYDIAMKKCFNIMADQIIRLRKQIQGNMLITTIQWTKTSTSGLYRQLHGPCTEVQSITEVDKEPAQHGLSNRWSSYASGLKDRFYSICGCMRFETTTRGG